MSRSSLKRPCVSTARLRRCRSFRRCCQPPGQFAFTRQQRPLGLGHAVWRARNLVGEEPFAVMLVDDLMVGEPPCLKQMVDTYSEIGGNMRAVEKSATVAAG